MLRGETGALAVSSICERSERLDRGRTGSDCRERPYEAKLLALSVRFHWWLSLLPSMSGISVLRPQLCDTVRSSTSALIARRNLAAIGSSSLEYDARGVVDEGSEREDVLEYVAEGRAG